jgi:hypothetical protein
MCARQEAARAASRPITIVHALAIACGVGLVVSLMGTAFAGVRQSIGWLTIGYQALVSMLIQLASIDMTSRWVTLPITAMLASVVIASVAAYVIFADE